MKIILNKVQSNEINIFEVIPWGSDLNNSRIFNKFSFEGFGKQTLEKAWDMRKDGGVSSDPQ